MYIIIMPSECYFLKLQPYGRIKTCTLVLFYNYNYYLLTNGQLHDHYSKVK